MSLFTMDSGACRQCTKNGKCEHQKKITKTIIEERKKIAGVTNNSVLMSVSYLGRMTEKEFINAKQ